MDIPVITELNIDEFNAGVITIPQSMCTNIIFGARPSGVVFATQRPGINIFEDASETVSDALGRGSYHWDAVDALYFVNNDTVYKGNYSAPLGVTLTAGNERIEFFEVGSYLVILDAENNEGWTISEAASTTLVKITDLDFPPNQTPSLTLAKGGSELNAKLYTYCTNGEIFESNVEDPTAWGILNFITSENRSDGGVYSFKHLGHIAAAGERSIEFFYDNSNATGSTLNPRFDIVHDIGIADHNTHFSDSNADYFVGKTASGDVGVYQLANFGLNKISENDVDSFLTSAIIVDGVKIVGSGFSAGGRTFYVLTLYNINSGIVSPLTSIVFDSSTGFWNPWELAHTGIDKFALIDWTRSTGTRAGNGILSNGDIITVADDFNPLDATEAQVYVLADYVEPGYISDTSSTGESIPFEIITGAGAFNTQDDKFMDKLRVKGTPTDNAQLLTVQWSDESNNDYNVGRTIDMSNPKNKLNRLGKFKTRNFKLSGAFTEKVEIDGLQVQVK